MSLNKKRLKQFKAYKFMNRKLKFNFIPKLKAKALVIFFYFRCQLVRNERFRFPNTFFPKPVMLGEISFHKKRF